MNINFKLGDRSKTQHFTLPRSSSYSNCKNIRQRVKKMGVEPNATSAQFTSARL